MVETLPRRPRPTPGCSVVGNGMEYISRINLFQFHNSDVTEHVSISKLMSINSILTEANQSYTHPLIYHPRCIMFFSQYFSFPCQYHSTIAPYSSIHLPPTLYNVFLPVLQFSFVSTIPPLLHTHSSIYNPHCIMFFSQHFSFPLSVPFHHCSILIHPSTTHTV